MDPNRKVFFYQGKPPVYLLPLLIVLGVLVFTVLAVFGLFVGIAIGALVIVLGIARLLSSFKKKKPRTINENGRTTIILDEEDFEVIEKGKK